MNKQELIDELNRDVDKPGVSELERKSARIITDYFINLLNKLDEPPKEVTCKNYPIPKLDELGINYFNCNSCDFFINFDESNVSDDDFNHCPKCGYKLEVRR